MLLRIVRQQSHSGDFDLIQDPDGQAEIDDQHRPKSVASIFSVE